MARAIDLVRRFRHLRVVVIGDAMLDTYLEGSAARLCTEGPVPVVRQTGEEQAPGGAANSAANLRALGADVVFLGVIGTDPAGATLRQALRRRDVDDRWLVEDESVQTLHKLRILANNQYVVRFDAGETRACSPRTYHRLQTHLATVLPGCDLVVVSDYGYGAVPDELLTHLRTVRAAHPCPLVVDSKNLSRFRQVQATIVTPNHLEARLVVEPASDDDGLPRSSEVERIGRRLLEVIDSEYVAVTMAGQGVMVVGRNGAATHLPAPPVAEANDVGAGDSFTAATALALAAGGDAVEAATIGIEAAGIAVSRRRTAIVQHQELLQRMSLDRGAIPPTVGELAARLERERRQGKTIVFTNGVFDILHAGHVHLLREARRLGDVLVVGVNSDRGARRLKGKNRPINSERDRLALVAALDPVEAVVLFDETTPAGLIRALRPDIHVKGGDYEEAELPEAEAVREVGGRIVIVPLSGDVSTSSVIDRILALSVHERAEVAS